MLSEPDFDILIKGLLCTRPMGQALLTHKCTLHVVGFICAFTRAEVEVVQ